MQEKCANEMTSHHVCPFTWSHVSHAIGCTHRTQWAVLKWNAFRVLCELWMKANVSNIYIQLYQWMEELVWQGNLCESKALYIPVSDELYSTSWIHKVICEVQGTFPLVWRILNKGSETDFWVRIWWRDICCIKTNHRFASWDSPPCLFFPFF